MNKKSPCVVIQTIPTKRERHLSCEIEKRSIEAHLRPCCVVMYDHESWFSFIFRIVCVCFAFVNNTSLPLPQPFPKRQHHDAARVLLLERCLALDGAFVLGSGLN